MNFTDVNEAMKQVAVFKQEIQDIERQLKTRRGFDDAHRQWKTKAQAAIAAKTQQLLQIQQWVRERNGFTQTRPNLRDAIHEKLCELVVQYAKFKRRAYADYKAAQAAFALLKEQGNRLKNSPAFAELFRWLKNANFPVEEIGSGEVASADYDDEAIEGDYEEEEEDLSESSESDSSEADGSDFSED